jgi:hypothetical protein
MPLDLSAFRHRGPMFWGHLGRMVGRERITWGFWLMIDPEPAFSRHGELMLAAIRIECTIDPLVEIITKRLWGHGAPLRRHLIWGLRWRFACDLSEINRRRLALVR